MALKKDKINTVQVHNVKTAEVIWVRPSEAAKMCKDVVSGCKTKTYKSPWKIMSTENTEAELIELRQKVAEYEAAAATEAAAIEEPMLKTANVQELKEAAKLRGIVGYSNMNKETLLNEIEAHDKAAEEAAADQEPLNL